MGPVAYYDAYTCVKTLVYFLEQGFVYPQEILSVYRVLFQQVLCEFYIQVC